MNEFQVPKTKELPPIVPGLAIALKQGLTPDLFLDSENVVSNKEREFEPLGSDASSCVESNYDSEEKTVIVPDLSRENYSDPFEARYCRRRLEGELDSLEEELRSSIKSHKLIIVKGPSGVGKTTVVRYCIKKLRDEAINSTQDHTVLWLDLKLISGFDKEAFYEMLYQRIQASFPRFPFDPTMWDEHLNTVMSKEERFQRKVNNAKEASAHELELIHEVAVDHQRCVVEFVKYRRRKFPESLILLIADNIDTALVKMSSETKLVGEGSDSNESLTEVLSWQRKLIQTVLSETVASNQALRKFIDATIISTRLDTYAAFEADLKIQVEKKEFPISAVDPYFGIKGRIDYVKACVRDWELNSQHFHEVNIHGFKPVQYQGLRISKRRDEYRYPFERFPRFYKKTPDNFPETFLVFSARSYLTSLADFTFVGNLVQSALQVEDNENPTPPNPILLGARGNVAWTIFRLLCGNSMRKAIELSGVVLESPGLYHQAVSERGVRAYAFLDSLVDSAFNGSSSGIGANSEKYIGNIYISDVSQTEALLFLPSLVSFLVLKKLQDPVDLYMFNSRSVDNAELIAQFKQLGFSQLVVEEGLKRACKLGFLKPISNVSGVLVGYNIDESLVAAHDFLIYEAAYVDNVVFALKDRIAAFRDLRKTVGFNPLDLPDRIVNSQSFIEALINSELAFSKKCDNELLDRWARVGVDSVAIRSLARYIDRLNAISKRMPASVFKKVTMFRSHFESLLNLPTLDNLSERIPLFPFRGSFR
jgi:hypothetical protein